VICSESGRAIVSHHSVLVFEAVSASTYEAPHVSSPGLLSFVEHLGPEAYADYRNLYTCAVQGEYESCLSYADQFKQRCVEQFKEGTLDIEQLAAVDGVCEFVSKAVGASDDVRTYHVNLSVFTSVPDFWGIHQLFPIVPIHRLDEKPSVRGVLSDLTCDSDGKIDKFIGGESSLPLHTLEGEGKCGGGYYLGMFLGGAYEEALGGLHNLFGGPSVVRVLQSDGPQSFAVTRAVPGPSCADVLRAMQHEPELMFETLKHRAEEFMHDENGTGLASLATRLARSFRNMPYLVTAASCGNDDPFGGVGIESPSEDEQWSAYCIA
jgi:arginine decarboxylase